MEINEKTKTTLGFVVTMIGGVASLLILIATQSSALSKVEEKALSLESKIELTDKRVDRLSDRVMVRIDNVDQKLYEIQKLLIEMNNRRR